MLCRGRGIACPEYGCRHGLVEASGRVFLIGAHLAGVAGGVFEVVNEATHTTVLEVEVKRILAWLSRMEVPVDTCLAIGAVACLGTIVIVSVRQGGGAVEEALNLECAAGYPGDNLLVVGTCG